MKYRFATFAVPLSGNKGSASMFLGLQDAFRNHDAEVKWEVFSYYPKRDAGQAAVMPDVDVRPGHPKHIFFQLLPAIFLMRVKCDFLVPRVWRKHVDILRQCDAVFLMGGTTFADSMLYKVPWNILAALPGYMLKRPTFFLSQTFGPFKKVLNRWAAVWTLRHARCVHGRGRDSEEWLQRIGLAGGEYQPDLSLPMHVPEFDVLCRQYPAVKELKEYIDHSGTAPVGITPNSIVHEKLAKAGKDYIEQLVEIITYVKGCGYAPVLIPHSYRDDVSRLHNNDRALCLAVMKKLPADSCYYLDADLPAPELRSIIGRMHILVASRFHSMVSALSMGVPAITFGWGNHKYSEVLKEFNADELYVPFYAMTTEKFRAMFDHVAAQRDALASRIKQAGVDVKKQAEGIVELIVKQL